MGRVGKQTIVFKNPPVISCAYSSVGPKEAAGPLSTYFDHSYEDELLGQDTWEKAESKLIENTIQGLLTRSGKNPTDIEFIFAGDLENQIVASTFGVSSFNIPYFGLYGACSTMGESLCLASMAIGGGMAQTVIAGTSSHYCAAEKQFRYPLEYAGQRTLTQQWTVTGSGYVLVTHGGKGPQVEAITPGKIVDLGISDTFNMGAAMAPAAIDTIVTHLEDTGRRPCDFDAIITGDLGNCGVDIAITLAHKLGYDLKGILNDCGKMIFDNEKQDTHSGGSGCGCSASVFTGYLYKQLLEGKLKRILLVPTGALMSPTSGFQGNTIPGIAHAVSIVMK
ncbi:stage V sporulation protein AD [Sporanaerobium hydrogeniformans]|uniref:Stage V sporulation protein AD n=1 Tax=Sporanaerobium hydrogeniformans TaxID=3072179 RepID=A0AC61DH72_9FIRM|nr:stage V sporulation protein AD [Sporanaerobium hydrogeniformans]PHV71657.1 stage V sporulation protein AD [Sporanaerobium hydrogeniformans]